MILFCNDLDRLQELLIASEPAREIVIETVILFFMLYTILNVIWCF